MFQGQSDRRSNALCWKGLRNTLLLLALLTLTVPLSACRTAAQDAPTSGESTEQNTPPAAPTARPTREFSEIRPAAVAGAFYPADPAQVRGVLHQYLDPVQKVDGAPIALIVPHAGWAYSGQVAAVAYKQIESVAYDTIVIIGPNHTDPTFDAISVYAQGAFETPLGLLPIDEGLAAELLDAHEDILFDRDVHQEEHSIEVQLPFLQWVCDDCAIVPILIGQPTPENLDILTAALVDTLRDRRALVIASSDLSHYPNYEDAVRVDTQSLVTIESMDDEQLSAVMAAQMAQQVPGLVTCACGAGPIIVAMRVAQALGADHVRILGYANSGDVSGDRSRVVGYGAVMFWQWQPPQFSENQRTELLSIARATMEGHLATGETPALPPSADPELNRPLGAFVTLTLDGELRGCIGHMMGDTPLYQTVAQAAVDAATGDPRFPPLPAIQAKDVEIEISVLSPFKRVRDVHDEDQIQVGRHGLYLLYGQQRGVLLPQVPVAQGWDRAEFLEQICLKAGLPTACWEQATLYTFTAQVFGEDEHH
jgi:AmmeMemoRadiSam system protein B/AmmeMemoRadiSam system protein A